MKPVALILASILVISSNMTISKNKVANATSNDLIIQNITLISSERNVPLDHAFVRVRLGRIVEVSTTEIIPDKNDRVVDGRGKYLIPGLMDSHVHLKYMPGIAFGDNGPLTSLKHLQKAFEPICCYVYVHILVQNKIPVFHVTRPTPIKNSRP